MKKLSSKKVLWTSLGVDCLDIALNVAVSVISGSVIALTEALQGAMDLLTSGSLLIGHSNAKKRASGSFQFGFGKEVYFWTLISAFLMLFITGFLSVYFGYERLINPSPIKREVLVFVALIIAVTTNFYAFWLSVKRLRANSGLHKIWESFLSSTLIEIKTSFVLDLMGTVAGLFGLVNLIIYIITGNPKFDGIGAICVGFVVIGFSLFIIYELRKFITGRSADEDTLKKIKSNILSFPEVEKLSDLRTMYLGSDKLVVNVDITVDENMEVGEAVSLVEKIKGSLRDNVANIKYSRIELDD